MFSATSKLQLYIYFLFQSKREVMVNQTPGNSSVLFSAGIEVIFLSVAAVCWI